MYFELAMQRYPLTSIIERDGDVWVATCLEFDIASQGSSLEEADVNLREAVTLFLDVASHDEVQRRLSNVPVVKHFEIFVG